MTEHRARFASEPLDVRPVGHGGVAMTMRDYSCEHGARWIAFRDEPWQQVIGRVPPCGCDPDRPPKWTAEGAARARALAFVFLGRTPICVICGDPIPGYVVESGDGPAHEEPCGADCVCEHMAEEHYERGLPCQVVEEGVRCPCPRYRPVEAPPESSCSCCEHLAPCFDSGEGRECMAEACGDCPPLLDDDSAVEGDW